MPKQPNITLYSCDRPSCVNKEYVLPNATASPNWHEVTRVDRNGNQRKILFCESDYQQYLQLAENQDKDYDLWLNKSLNAEVSDHGNKSACNRLARRRRPARGIEA